MNPGKLVVATRNQHKIDEIAAILGSRMDVVAATAVAFTVSWDETGETFEANARIKADALAAYAQPGMCILADDSGLAVDALGGAPGVYSSRYAGIEGDDAANNTKLLQALAGVEEAKRRARFICVLVYRDANGKETVWRGECPGSIAQNPLGDQGFGYDPLFIPDGFSCSMAELKPEEKNKISHRRKALDQWLASLT